MATDRGEELAIGQLEIEMESALSPREIQTRIRSGESVDDVARVAGIDKDRVERFAAPVVAEREHVAGLAMTSSARRRGETSSHRTLRGVLNERLLSRGIDIDSVRWDSYRLDDGRWAVTADYLSGGSPRQAQFSFDLAGRYSVAGNDEGRWVLGDTPSAREPQPARRPPSAGEADGGDTEPTLDLSDELALVRAIQDVPVADAEDSLAEVVQLNREQVAAPQPEQEQPEPEQEQPEAEQPQPEQPQPEQPQPEQPQPEQPQPDGELAEPTVRIDRAVGSRPSEAPAVPELATSLGSGAWEPAIIVDYPVEPSEAADDVDGIEVPEGSDDPGRPEPAVSRQDRWDESDALADPPLPIDVPESDTPPAAPKTARRKRASVPSWDEIVFGGPKES